jgi:uncharacterized protein YdaT
MPWGANDAIHKTKKANTPKKKEKWAAIANNVLARTAKEGMAIRIANSKM